MILALLLQAASAAPPAAAPPSAPPATVPVPWTVARITAKGAPAISTAVWSQDGKARLVIRCDTGAVPVVSIQFIPKPGFPAATPRPVSINADDSGWFGANWLFPGAGAYVADEVIVTNLLSMVAHAKAIRVRVTDPDNGTVEATFAGPPGDAPIRAVLSACAYELGKVPPHVPATPAAPASTNDDQ